MMRRQNFVERLGTKLVGIECFQRLARRFFGRHQAVLDEPRHEIAAPLQITVAPPAHAARDAPISRVRFFGFRIAPIGENAHAARTEAGGFSLAIKPDDKPAKRIRSDVDTETIGLFGVVHSCAHPPGIHRISAYGMLTQLQVEKKIWLGAEPRRIGFCQRLSGLVIEGLPLTSSNRAPNGASCGSPLLF